VADTIRLDIAASPDLLPIVRMIVGGVGARLELSLDDLEDVYLALEELVCAAVDAGEGPRLTISAEIGDDALDIHAGPFRSAALRDRCAAAGDPAGGLDLATLFEHVVESLGVRESGDGRFVVSFRKRRGG
jgi:serine/threonine-protein kinase RsbW